LLSLSCTKEIESSNNSELRIVNKYSESELKTAKELFLNMINTYEYLDYKNSIDIFAEKMNGNAIFFKSKEEYLFWINVNLSKTNFESVDEFEILLNDMITKNIVLENKNSMLYKYLNSADQQDFINIVRPSLGAVPITTLSNSCTNGCISDCEDALAGNEWAYHNDYGTNSHAFALQYYWVRYKSICDSFSACIGSC